MKLTHELFIDVLNKLDFPVHDGVCQGFQMILAQHLCGKVENEFFPYLMAMMNAVDLESLIMEINSPLNRKLKNFFEEIAHYQNPFDSKFNLSENGQQIELISEKLSLRNPSHELIKQIPLKSLYKKALILNRMELKYYLNQLIKKLELLSEAPLAILLSNDNHAIGIKWDFKSKRWINCDINLIENDDYLQPVYKTAELVETIFNSFADTEKKYTGFAINIVTSKIYHDKNHGSGSVFQTLKPQLRRPTDQSQRINARGVDLLHIAVSTLCLDDVNYLLTHKDINPNPLNQTNQTPLHKACILRSVELVNALMTHPDIDPNTRDTEGYSPLDRACQNGDRAIVEMLLNHKDIAINDWNPNNEAPLHVACQNENVELVKILLTHKDIVLNEWDKYGTTPFHAACMLNNVEIAQTLLTHKNILPHEPNNEGISPRETASLLEFTEIINIIDAHDLSIIQKAVDIAQKKYSQWYSGEQHRGANGFFSWLRHGSLGQQNAFLMNQELNNTHTAYEDAITLINEFLMDDNKTPYHRHSFASFLLDELNQIPSSPWSNIKCDSETKLYDRLEVIKLLAPIAHITDEVPMNSYYVS